jgi:hypothetical protein
MGLMKDTPVVTRRHPSHRGKNGLDFNITRRETNAAGDGFDIATVVPIKLLPG